MVNASKEIREIRERFDETAARSKVNTIITDAEQRSLMEGGGDLILDTYNALYKGWKSTKAGSIEEDILGKAMEDYENRLCRFDRIKYPKMIV